MKHIILLSLFFIVSCDTIRPASEQLVSERRDTFIQSKHLFDNCFKKETYSVNFEAKYEKKKTGFSGMFQSNPKLIIKDISSIHFLGKTLQSNESECLIDVISKLELKVRDSRLSHEYFEVSLIRDTKQFRVELKKADYRNFKK